MRQKSLIASAGVATLALFTLAACSDSSERGASVSEASIDAAAPDMATKDAGASQPGPIAVSVPRIAYVYSFGFRLAADRLVRVQTAHADLCEKQGPQVCRILDMRQSGGEGEFSAGSLTLAVAAPQARAFGARLAKLAGDEDGAQVESGIAGEDLSKQIVDTEARLRARTVLRDRLMEVLATRKGTVAELVEAERGVAQVNEEIDQARSWLADMRQRVDYSRIEIAYNSGAPSEGGFFAPVRGALGTISAILGNMLAIAIVLLTIGIPLGLAGWGALVLRRRLFRIAPAARENAAPA